MQARRMERMAAQLDVLHAVCKDLGEDDAVAASEVHHTLRYFR